MIKIYLDTSVVSAYHDPRVPEFSALTREMFSALGKGCVFVGSVMLQSEVEAANPVRRKQMLSLMLRIGVRILNVHPAIETLATSYLKQGILPLDSSADAIHLAYATYYEIDYLASWNYRHLINDHRKQAFAHHNLSRGLFLPKIVSPGNLLEGAK